MTFYDVIVVTGRLPVHVGEVLADDHVQLAVVVLGGFVNNQQSEKMYILKSRYKIKSAFSVNTILHKECHLLIFGHTELVILYRFFTKIIIFLRHA